MINFNLRLFFIFALFSKIQTDIIFTSPLKTKALFASVDNLIATLEEYVNVEETRLNTLKNSLDDWVQEHDHNSQDIESHFSNLVDQFNYLYKLKQRWLYWKDATKNNTAADYFARIKNSNLTWPSEDDIVGVMDSIINLQNIYLMKAASFAKGELNGISTNTSLDYEECFMLTERCFEMLHYKLTLQWALVALEKYSEEGIENEEQLSKILYYISYTAHITGEDDLAFESITSYMKKNSQDKKGKGLQNAIHLRHPEKLEKHIIRKSEIVQHMKELCKKISTQEELSRINNLRCRYNRENSDYLIIAPLKEESISLNPPLILYHDVMYDSEIENLKNRSKNWLQGISTVQGITRSYNAVKIANFENDTSDDIQRISLRIQDMTTLPVKSKNKYQLYKFMAGGSYTDVKNEDQYQNFDQETSARIIFHMNNVIQGGSTIFPSLNITIKAEKGDALVWFDLIQSNTIDLPEYSSCSVVAGYKWILTSQIQSGN